MSSENQGFVYERKVKGVVQQAARAIPHFSVSSKSGLTQADAADLELLVGKARRRVPVEIKLDGRSQMGNPATVIFRNGSFDISPSTSTSEVIDPGTRGLILEELKKKQQAAEKFLKFIRGVPPAYNEDASGFPVNCSKFAWDEAKNKGLLRELNTSVRRDAKLISKHYETKDTHYIQIGGQGLFHLGHNPLDLPVPQLSGEVIVEIRLAHHGAKPHKELVERVTGDLRASIRLLTREKSEWSLDKRDHVLMLFGRG